jgi:tetratricopeptide (TPR) repeat protein
MNDRAGANAALDRASNDVWAVAALVDRAYVEREFFDLDRARAAAHSCVEARPTAVDCLAFLSRRAAFDGHCAEMDGYARRWIDADPDDPAAYETLGWSLAARGENDAAVREAFEQKWARLPEAARPAARLRDSIAFETLHGHFDAAMTHAQSALAALSADAPLLKRLTASFGVLVLASEMDDRRLVGEISSGILERASAATPPTPSEAAHFLLFVASNRDPEHAARWEEIRAAAFTRYDDYITAQGANVRPFQRILPWIVGHAAGASTAARRKAAYAALPRYAPLPPPGMALDDDLVIGTVLAANGESERGFAHLRSVTESCLVLETPLAVLRAYEVMGELHEAAGDTEAAKAAYEAVLARWGRATPRSRTVEAAKAGLARLTK